jgi:hypothetical protein
LFLGQAVDEIDKETDQKIASGEVPENEFSRFARNGQALAQPCLGVAVLKRELRICGEGGFAKNCMPLSGLKTLKLKVT